MRLNWLWVYIKVTVKASCNCHLRGLLLNKLILSSASKLWVTDSTQLFWLKVLSKLTDAIWLLLTFHWIALLGLKLILEICSNFLPLLSLWLQLALYELTNKLNSTALNSLSWTAPNWLNSHSLAAAAAVLRCLPFLWCSYES